MYGYLLCARTGRVLVQDDDGVFNLPGGTPEPQDAGLAETLVREAFEESQVRVGATAYLGYQEVHRPGRARYAQVLGSSRARAASTARSAQSSFGLGFCRRSTATSWRSTSNSASLDAEERARHMPRFGTPQGARA